MPELQEQREGRGAKRDLTQQAVPELRRGDERLELFEGVDFRVSIYRGSNVEAPLLSGDHVAQLTDAGAYRAVVTGVSPKLYGQVAVPFEVKKRKRRKWPIVLLLLALAGAGILAALYFTGNAPWYDPNAGEGLAGIHDDDIQAYLDAKVEEGKMNMTVLSRLVFEDGTMNEGRPGEIGFNNLQGNHFDQKLTITLDQNDMVVYESPGAIAPGQNIQYITLNRDLDPGGYAATATVTGYDRETHEEVGQLAAKIVIYVMD